MTDYRDLAEDLGVDTEHGRLTGQNLYTRCPLHEGDHRNFALHVSEGVWYCHRGCGGGNIVTLVKVLRECSWVEAVTEVARYEQGQLRAVSSSELLEALSARPDNEEEDVPRAVRTGRLTRDRWPSWWRQRGFDAADWHRWDCMMDRDSGDVSIPVFTSSMELAGEVRRRMPGAEPKYLYSEGFTKSRYLFGDWLTTASDRVFVVEGPLDTMWLHHMGLPAVGLLGSSCSLAQLAQLAGGWREIVVALDNDEAGHEGAYDLLRRLTALGARAYGLLWPANDAQDMSEEEVLETVAKRVREPVAFTIELSARGAS